MPIFALFISYPATGFTKVETYATQFDRAIRVIGLSSQPLTLKTVDYAHDGLTPEVN